MNQRLFVAEPPQHDMVLPPLVVDCSTLAGLVFQEEWQPQAAARISGKALHAPTLLRLEITSVAAKKQMAGRADIALDGLQLFALMDIELHPVEPSAILALATLYRISTYDAAYLWLAAELKAPPATFDENWLSPLRHIWRDWPEGSR